MDDTLKEPRKGDLEVISIAAGLVLILIAVSLAFVATCFPLAFAAHVATFDIVIALWVIGAIPFGIWRATVAKDSIVRWAIIVVTLLGGLAAAQWALSEFSGIRLY